MMNILDNLFAGIRQRKEGVDFTAFFIDDTMESFDLPFAGVFLLIA